jgi:1,4-alpha-glucan branching enzyme
MKVLLFPALLSCLLIACNDENAENNNGNGNGATPEVLYREGITRISDDSLAFVLFAPGKTQIHLIGDFNNWAVSDSYNMTKDGNHFRLKIGGLDKNKEYICQYLIDNRLRIADPYANKISDPTHDASISPDIYPNLITYPTGKTTEIAMVVSTRAENFQWQVENFKPEAISKLVIYEILIRDFTDKRSIKGVQEKLPYLKSLGVNAVELLPFNEFEGNDSWGYNPSFYFATDKAYGTNNDYKIFIDACHQNGIAVVMDMVLNHSYGQSPLVRMYQNSNGTPSSSNPWYNTASPNQTYSWGYDFNHESQYTQQFVDSVCAYWIQEYKVDGFRFDFTKGFTNKPGDGWNFDQSRIDILKRIAEQIWKRKKDALVILEHLTENREEKVLADYGMLLWGNLNYRMNEATMGWTQKNADGTWNSDISWGSYKERDWTLPNLVAYMESHDEERLMYKNNQYGKDYEGYNVKNLSTGLQRTAGATVLFFTLPGPKMMWQFGELGYDYFLGSSAEEGRLEKKPIRWDYYDISERKALFDVFATMLALKKEREVFNTSNFVYELQEPFKYITLISPNTNVVAMANFDVVEVEKNVNFSKTGKWKDYFTDKEITVSSSTENVILAPGEYRLYFSD